MPVHFTLTTLAARSWLAEWHIAGPHVFSPSGSLRSPWPPPPPHARDLAAEVQGAVAEQLSGLSSSIDQLEGMLAALDNDTVDIADPSHVELRDGDDRLSETQWQLVEATEELVRTVGDVNREIEEINEDAQPVALPDSSTPSPPILSPTRQSRTVSLVTKNSVQEMKGF